MRGWGLLFMLLASSVSASEAVRVSSIVRQADYTIGGIARQQITIETPRGYRLDPGSLPEKGQTDAIELRDAQWEVKDSGGVSRHRIALDWQIFVAGDTTRLVPLKALQLQFLREDKMLPVRIKSPSVIVSSLLPAKMDKHFVQPYPDASPPAMPLRAAWAGLVGGAMGLLLTGLYFAHYFGWLFQARAPMHFRSAARDIRRLRLSRNGAEAIRPAMQRLAHAYDAYAGHALGLERIEDLLEIKPDLNPLAQESRAFYLDLHRVFFGGHAPQHDVEALELLARRLSRLEAL